MHKYGFPLKIMRTNFFCCCCWNSQSKLSETLSSVISLHRISKQHVKVLLLSIKSYHWFQWVDMSFPVLIIKLQSWNCLLDEKKKIHIINWLNHATWWRFHVLTFQLQLKGKNLFMVHYHPWLVISHGLSTLYKAHTTGSYHWV